MIPTIQNSRKGLFDSLYNKIPTTGAPTVPIPVHTAYATDKGIVARAMRHKFKLMITTIHNSRHGLFASLYNNLPTTVAPTVPLPVHTAYATDKGIVSRAMRNKFKLMINPPIRSKYANKLPFSDTFLMPITPTISVSPASIKYIQLM